MTTPLSELEAAALSVMSGRDSCGFTGLASRAVAEATVGRLVQRLRQLFAAQYNRPGVTAELHLMGEYEMDAMMGRARTLRYVVRRTGEADIYCDISAQGIVRLPGVPRS